MSVISQFLCAAMAFLAVAADLSRAGAQETGYPNAQLLLSRPELLELMYLDQRLRIIDVRPKEDYDAGHIPGAIHLAADEVTDRHAHVDGARLSDEALASLFGRRGIDKDARVVLYDDRGGFHGARVFWMLEYLGHGNVSLLDGGLSAWTAGSGSLSTEPERPKPAVFSPTPTPRRSASADWLLDRRDDASTAVIDVRPSDKFAKGHIPWAINIPWADNLDGDNRMEPAAVLREHFASRGVTPDKSIAVHCQNGKASAHTYFALRLLGYPNVRVYDRSWAEWGMSDDLPKTLPGAG